MGPDANPARFLSASKVCGLLPRPSRTFHPSRSTIKSLINRPAAGKDYPMYKFIKITLAVASVAGVSLAALPATAGETVGVHVGDLGVTVGNGHYYDRNHRRHSYSYPSDWRSYNHSQSWYRSHRQWNNQQHADWYRN